MYGMLSCVMIDMIPTEKRDTMFMYQMVWSMGNNDASDS